MAERKKKVPLVGEDAVPDPTTDLLDRIKSSAKDSARAFLSTGLGQTLMLGVKEIDPDIQELSKKVMEAANGKPLKISVTEQEREQKIMAPIIKQMLTSQILAGGSEASIQSQSSDVGSSEGSVQDEIPVVSPEDLLALKESIDALSSQMAEGQK